MEINKLTNSKDRFARLFSNLRTVLTLYTQLSPSAEDLLT